jgi:hypothetical protein
VTAARRPGVAAFAIKAEVTKLGATTFRFSAQKTMYGGQADCQRLRNGAPSAPKKAEM